MKKTILFLFFFSIQLFYSQPGPPPLFKIQYTCFGENKKSFLENFDVVATRFRLPVEFGECQNEFNDNIQARIWDASHILLYIYNKDRMFPRESDIIRLSIKQKRTGKIMSVFIPAIDTSEKTRIDHLGFLEGNFFYGRDHPDENHKGNFYLDEYENNNLIISDLESHRISPEHLHTILTEICQKD